MSPSDPQPKFNKTALATAITFAIIGSMPAAADCPLEAPLEISSFVVTTTSDVVDSCDNETSLREAVNHANNTSGEDTITFADSALGDIQLDTELLIQESIAIDGPANADDLTIRTTSGNSLFNVAPEESGQSAIDFKLSRATISGSPSESILIEVDGYGGSIELDGIKVDASTDANSLIKNETKAFIHDTDASQNLPGNVAITLKNSVISGSTFDSEIIYNETNSDEITGDNTTLINILDSQVIDTDVSSLLRTKAGTSNITLANTTITGGSWKDSVIQVEAYGESNTFSIKQSRIINTQLNSDSYGGLINSGSRDNSMITEIVDTIITGNSARFGIISQGDPSKLIIENSDFNDNKLIDGGIANVNRGDIAGSTTIKGSTINGNTAIDPSRKSDFASIFSLGTASLEVSNTKINNNTLGGIELGNRLPVNVLIENTTISGNSSPRNGAGITSVSQESYAGITLNVMNSTIANNHSDLSGGGIALNAKSHLNLRNSTISGNSSGIVNGDATYGGGIHLETLDSSQATATITNSTIVGNSVNGYGGGIAIRPNALPAEQSVTITNSIVANNTSLAGYDSNLDLYGHFVVNHSLIKSTVTNGETKLNGVQLDRVGDGEGQTVDSKSNLLNIDPALQGLKLSGGAWVHNLTAESPAIAAGDADAVDLPATEQRGEGFARVRGVSNGKALDLGAVQYFINPIAVNDDASLESDSDPITIEVLANDAQSSDGLALDNGSVTIIDHPSHGSVDTQNDGRVTYSVEAKYVGADSFTYVVTDLAGITSNKATVLIDVIKTPPAAVDSSTNIEKGTEKSKSGGGSTSSWILIVLGLLGLRRFQKTEQVV